MSQKEKTHRSGKLQAIKLVLETIWTTKHGSCGEETTDLICVPIPTQTKTASACNQILQLTNCIKMKSDENKIFSYPNFILKLFSVYLFQLISLIRVFFPNTLIITIIINIIIVIVFQHFIAVLKVSPYI
jgi:hypothetical protein